MADPNVYVCPSGQGIAWVADGPVTALASNSAIQSLAILDAPVDYSSTLPFTLTFNGQTTATITAVAVPPVTYFQWNKADLPAGTYDLYANFFLGGTATPKATYEVFQGTDPAALTYIDKGVLNQARDDGAFYGGPADPAPVADPVLVRQGDGQPVNKYKIGRFTTTAAGIAVRLSCPPNEQTDGSERDFISADDIWIDDTSGTNVARLTTARPPATLAGGWFGGVASAQVAGDPGILGAIGTGAGPRFVLDPADVRSKFQALSTVGAGNVAVTGTGTPADPIRLAFTGSLADAAQPPITCSLDSSHVAISAASVGGILPSIKVNGTPVALPHTWFVWSSASHVWPVVHAMFPQCPPAETVIGPGYYDAQALGLQGTWARAGNGFEGAAQYSYGVGPSCPYYFRPVAPGTYRVSLTWTPASDLTTDAVLTVRSFATDATLATYHFDQTQAPSGATSHGLAFQVGGSITLTAPRGDGLVFGLTNATSARMVADAVRVERTSPDTSLRIGPDDVVTYSAGAGWYTTAGGPAPAKTDAPADNRVGGTIYTPSTAPTTMPIGYNLAAANQATPLYYYTDLSRHTYSLMARDASGTLISSLPLTLLGGSSVFCPMTAANPDFNAHRRAGLNVRTGRYDLWWKGASDAGLSAGTAGTWAEVTASAVFPETVNGWHRRAYDLGGDPFNWSPFVDLVIHGTSPVGDGTWHADFADFHILPDGMDPDNFPKYHPAFTATFIGQTGRCMDLFGTVEGNCTTFEDFDPPDTIRGKGLPARQFDVPIGKVEAYTGTEYDFSRVREAAFKFTSGTAASPAPHGLSQFQKVSAIGFPPVTITDGTNTASYSFDGSYSPVYVLSPTEFVYFSGPRHTPAWHMSGTLTDPGGHVAFSAGAGGSISDVCEIWRAQGLDLHFNSSAATTTDALFRLGQKIGHPTTGIAPGKKLLHEFMNETWNFGFPTYAVAASGSAIYYGSDPDDETAFTCEHSVIHWNALKAGWVDAGRDPADFVRVLGTNNDNQGTTQQRASYMAARRDASIAANGDDGGYDFEALCGAPYFGCFPAGTGENTAFAPTIDLMTAAQHLDCWETTWTYSGYGTIPASHRGILASHGYGAVEYIGYEGGPGYPMLLGGTGWFGVAKLNSCVTGHAVWMHPRMHGILQNNMKILQDGGLSRLHIYQYHGSDSFEAIGWPTHTATGQLDYQPGDPTQDAIQVDQYDQLDLIRSVTGGAVKSWANRYNAAAPSPDFTLAASGTSHLVRGATTTRTVTLTASGGFAGTAALTVGGLPTGVTAGFSPSSLTGGGTVVSTLTLTASSSATLGAATLTITGTDSADSLTHTATTSVTVDAASTPADYTVAVAGSGTLTQGSTATRTVTLTPSNGYTGTATLSASGLPTGVTAAFSPTTVTGGGTVVSTLTLTASGSATVGTVTITVTAADSGNSLTHSGTSSLTVAPASSGAAVSLRRIRGFHRLRA